MLASTDHGLEADMSDSAPNDEPLNDEPLNEDPLENGLDKGSGDPNDDRDFLMDQPPAQVNPQEDRGDEDASR